MHCPRDWHRPVTEEGQIVADLMPRIMGQVRTAGMGQVVGLDLTAALALTDAEGIDRAIAIPLIGGIERGTLWAYRPKGDDDV